MYGPRHECPNCTDTSGYSSRTPACGSKISVFPVRGVDKAKTTPSTISSPFCSSSFLVFTSYSEMMAFSADDLSCAPRGTNDDDDTRSDAKTKGWALSGAGHQKLNDVGPCGRNGGFSARLSYCQEHFAADHSMIISVAN